MSGGVMYLFNRFMRGSAKSPEVKVEEPSEETGPRDTFVANQTQEANIMLGPEKESEAHTDWEGFGDEEQAGGKGSANASVLTDLPRRTKKNTKNRKHDKRRAEQAAEDFEVEKPELGGDDPEGRSPPDVAGKSSKDRNFKQNSTHEASTVERPSEHKSSRKMNGVARKIKRASKSEKTLLVDHGTGLEDRGAESSTALVDATIEHVKKVKRTKSRKSRRAASEPKSVPNVHVDIMTHGTPISESPQVPRESSEAKEAQARDSSYERATNSQQIQDSSFITHKLGPSTSVSQVHGELDAQKDIGPVVSPQLQAAAPSTISPGPSNDEDANGEPKRLSKKALGKRKVVDQPLAQVSNKKRKRVKEKEAAGRDLTTFGFVPSDEALAGSTKSPVVLKTPAPQASPSVSLEPEPPSKSQKSITSSASLPSWNAINNQAEPHDRDESDDNLFVHNSQEPEAEEVENVAAKRSGRKRNSNVDKSSILESTPSANSRRTLAKPAAKTPKSPKVKGKEVRTASVSKFKLSTDALDAITSAVESYREFCGISEVQMNELIQSDAQGQIAQQMWKAVCGEVPYIPRRTVQNTCRRKFHNFEGRGVWTEEQDEELKRAYEERPGKWKLIGETLNRFPEDARDRWRNYLFCGDKMKKDAWDLQEEDRLRTAVKQCIQKVLQHSDNKALNEESLIDWQIVSELMGRTRSRLQCRNKWQKLKDREKKNKDNLVAKMPIARSWRLQEAVHQATLFSAEEKLVLLQAIRDSGALSEDKIPWQIIIHDLDAKGKRMAWRYCFRKLKDCVPNCEEMEFKEIVNYLVESFEKAAPDEPEGFHIPIETFSPCQTTPNKKTQSSKRGFVDDDGPSSSIQASRRKKATGRDTDGEGASASSTKSRKVRDRMLKEGESQDTANSQERTTSPDVAENVAQGFQSIKRTPKAKGKYVTQKSKRNRILSTEKVIESSSENEENPVRDVNGAGLDSDYEDNSIGAYAAHGDAGDTEPNEPQDNGDAPAHGVNGNGVLLDREESDVSADTPASPNEVKVEELSEHGEETSVNGVNEEEMDVDEEGSYTNARGPFTGDFDADERDEQQDSAEDSDLDSYPDRLQHQDPETQVQGSKFRLGSPMRANGYAEGESDGVSSDDDDMSDIPFQRQPRMESPEL